MKVEYMAVTKQEGGWWVGWIEEVPGVNCQERTHGELLESLRVTLQEEVKVGDGYESIHFAADII